MTNAPGPARPITPRQVADAYVEAVCDLDPLVATSFGTRLGDDRLPDPGADFDLEAWHMAALSQGSLGLEDLADELAQL